MAEKDGIDTKSFGVGRPGGKVVFKISKKDGSAPVDLLAFSEAEIDDLADVHEHRAQLGRLIYTCEDPAALRQIAALLGFVPPPESEE